MSTNAIAMHSFCYFVDRQDDADLRCIRSKILFNINSIVIPKRSFYVITFPVLDIPRE